MLVPARARSWTGANHDRSEYRSAPSLAHCLVPFKSICHSAEFRDLSWKQHFKQSKTSGQRCMWWAIPRTWTFTESKLCPTRKSSDQKTFLGLEKNFSTQTNCFGVETIYTFGRSRIVFFKVEQIPVLETYRSNKYLKRQLMKTRWRKERQQEMWCEHPGFCNFGCVSMCRGYWLVPCQSLEPWKQNHLGWCKAIDHESAHLMKPTRNSQRWNCQSMSLWICYISFLARGSHMSLWVSILLLLLRWVTPMGRLLVPSWEALRSGSDHIELPTFCIVLVTWIILKDPGKKLCESTNLIELLTPLKCELWLKRPDLWKAQKGLDRRETLAKAQ